MIGSWQSPRLTNLDIIVLISTLITQASIRAWDYSTGNEQPDELALIERAFSLPTWGIILFTLAGLLAVGIFLKIHMLVWAMHGLLACVYFTLMVGIMLTTINTTDFPWDGIRFGGLLFTPMMLHGIFALRTGPNPHPVEEMSPVETVVREDG